MMLDPGRYGPAIAAKLYWFPISHPGHAVRKLLELKGIEYELAGVLPGTQKVHLRLAGFRGGTVPALVLDGRRVQGSRAIARALGLAPGDAAAEEAERWGEAELQPVPRRILRWGLVRHGHLRTWVGEQCGVPLPSVGALLSRPAAWYYARDIRADEAAVRRDLAELPATLDRVDALLADGVIGSPGAATFQVLCSVRSLAGFADLHDLVASRPSAAAARELFPDWPDPVPPFLPQGWLP
jgi:glutathione S-transferase